MKRRKNNTKKLIALSAILGSSVLMSIGFATWIITGEGELSTENEDIIVDNIDDFRLSIDYTWASTGTKAGPDIIFGWSNYVNPTTGNWLIDNDNTKKENLSDTLNVIITNQTYLDKVEVTFTPIDNADGGWADAVENDYVVAPTFSDVTTWSTIEGDKASFSLQVKFNWGEAFDADGTPDENLEDNLNPIEFYNRQEFSNELADEAKTTIGNLFSYVSGVKFKLTLKAMVKK